MSTVLKEIAQMPSSVFLEADVLVGERIREIEELASEPEGAGRRDLLHEVVAGILECGQPRGMWARRRRVPRGRTAALGQCQD
jgi:hypothetical protein